MSFPAEFFKGLLKTLAGQFIDNGQESAECIGKDFGTQINQYAKVFFSVSLIEEDLPGDLAAIGVLVDNRAAEFNRNGYTFFIYIDSTKKHEEITDDLKTLFEKMVLSHETCHFVFYYELFLSIGADSTDTAYTQFQSKVSGQLEKAITREMDNTSQTVTDEHMYGEFLKNFWKYDNAHFDKKKLTGHDYKESNVYFFNYLTQK
jgi:flavodoxin